MKVIHSYALIVLAAFALFLTPEARAAYEYDCGPHRNAMCHQEPRGDEGCNANYGCYGRCGPGCDWTVLGNAYTNACANHDSCVRGKLCAGQSGFSAHSGCAGSLIVVWHWGQVNRSASTSKSTRADSSHCGQANVRFISPSYGKRAATGQ